MAPLGPWPPDGSVSPIAVAASGGPDSTALALLAARWAAARRLTLLALVVDHGLRNGSAVDAGTACSRLRGLGIATRLLRLDGLMLGPALAERARIARHAALARACAEAGAVDLLFGHHAGDQAETVLMRERAGSHADGLAGMASLVETGTVRLLRPLLGVASSRLRPTLSQAGIGWIEDPSNRDMRAQRSRVRHELAAAGPHSSMALAMSRHLGASRMGRQAAAAQDLAGSVELRPEGFALLPPELPSAATLAALVRTIGAASYPPAHRAIEQLLQRRRPCTLAGTRLLAAGRFGAGWLLLREAAAIGGPVAARSGALWDNRYRLRSAADLPDRLEVSALGPDRPPGHRRRLPSAVLATLPAIKCQGMLLAVPHLGWTADPALAGVGFSFCPPVPAGAASLFITA